MKKTIIALVCFTMSMVVSAQPQPQKNQECGKMECCKDNCCKDNCCKDNCCQQKCYIDSATMKTVMELRKKYHENFRKELRQTLGDEKYIQYLEAQVYMKQHRAMHKRMNGRRMGQWSKRRTPMMHHGFRGQRPGVGFKAADWKDKKDNDKEKSKDNKKNKKDNKK